MSDIVSKYRRRAWERRALTLKLKAADLMAEMIEALGLDHEGTDLADNVLQAAEDLTHFLGKDSLDAWKAPQGRSSAHD